MMSFIVVFYPSPNKTAKKKKIVAKTKETKRAQKIMICCKYKFSKRVIASVE